MSIRNVAARLRSGSCLGGAIRSAERYEPVFGDGVDRWCEGPTEAS